MNDPDWTHETAVLSSVDAATRRSARRRLILALSVAVSGVAISLMLSWLLLVRGQTLAKDQFKVDALQRIVAIQTAVERRIGSIDMFAMYLAGFRSVEREPFRAMTTIPKHPGLRWWAWAPRVTATQREAHEQAVRAEGRSKYEITERDDRGRFVRAGQRDEYFPIHFIEPHENNQSLIGRDMGSDATCRAAVERAMATRHRTVAFGLGAEDNQTAPSLLYIVQPIWNKDAPRLKRPAKPPEIEGLVLGEFRIDMLVEVALSVFPLAGIDVHIGTQGGRAPLYAWRSPLRGQETASQWVVSLLAPSTMGMHRVGGVRIGNRGWTVDCVPTPAYLAQQRSWGPAGTLLAGLVISGLLAGYILLLAGRTARIKQLVAERTRELHRSEGALRQEQRLLQEMLDLHERERKLVAFEIHDGLAQELTAAVYNFQAVGHLRDSDPEAARKTFDEAMRLLYEAMAEARRLVSGLRPPMLDESGVVAAVDCLIAGRREPGGPEIEFVHGAELPRFAPPLESAIFRIVQESLTNACRYSQSKKVRVELEQSAGRVRIDVQDWGVGFDPAAVKGEHFGLEGICERARVLGGVATIQAALQKGTRVTVELPVILPADRPMTT